MKSTEFSPADKNSQTSLAKKWAFAGAAVVVILLAAAIVVPYTQSNKVRDSRPSVVRLQLQKIRESLWKYNDICGRFPTSEEGLAVLIKPVECNGMAATAMGTESNIDPWGRPFIYESDGNDFTATTLGKDGAEGGTDEDLDVIISSREAR